MRTTRNTHKPQWRTPVLKAIGSIADVAGKPVPFRQAHNNRKS
ncbi:hypothetical protein [Erythrobacter sp. HKB08]|nr:hypothetical protein [Erythrobacter sp. HKB08]